MDQTEPYDPPEWLEHLVEDGLPGDGLVSWVPGGSFDRSGLIRVPRFPDAIERDETRDLELDVPRNGTRSAQLAVVSRNGIAGLRAEVSDFARDDGRTLPSAVVRTRFVGYVPVERSLWETREGRMVADPSLDAVSGSGNPDVIADPLFEADAVDVPQYRVQPVWFSVSPPADTQPGRYEGEIVLAGENVEARSYSVTLDVPDVTVPDPAAYEFHLDVWLNPDAVAVEHGVDRWSEAHWNLLGEYFDDLASAGQRSITAPIVHQPWQREWLGGERRSQTDVGYSSLIEWRHDGEWHFEYGRFDRFVETALAHGVGPEICAHSPLVFRSPQRITYYEGDDDSLTVERVEAGGERWREVWSPFLEDFSSHLAERGWLDRTYLAFDERPPELLEPALDVVESAAPEFSDRIHVAGSIDVEPYADDLSLIHDDLPIDRGTLRDRRRAGKRTTFYACVHPAHPNTFTASPLQESRMLPWIAANQGLDGFLRWAYNSWPRRPLENPVFRFTQGDEYLVYPGENGPVASLRWEQLREGIEEYELVSELRRRDPDSATLERALTIATRRGDARDKDPSDLVDARATVIEELERLNG